MKKSLKTVLFGLSSTLALGLAVGAVLSANTKMEEVHAAGTTNRLLVKFGSLGNWTDANAKLAVYLWNDDVGGVKKETWTSLASLNTSTKLYVLNYTADFSPAKMIISRQNSSATSASWGTSWAQSGDLDFNEATYINLNGWDITATSGWTLSATVNTSEVDFGVKTTIGTASLELNSDGNPQIYGKVTLEENEEFKVVSGDAVWTGYYGCPSALNSAFTGGGKEKPAQWTDLDNITCLIAGDYDFYFDTEEKRIWISRQEIVDADGWASSFLTDVTCDSTGKTVPTGWSTSSGKYSNLSDDAKDYIYAAKADANGDNLARALARYDLAVYRHSTLTKFVKNSAGTERNVPPVGAAAPIKLFNIDSNNASLFVIITVIASISILGGYLFLKRRKESR